MVIQINENDFKDKTKETCIVDFYSTWCPPCKQLSTVMDKVSEKHNRKLNFYKINIDGNGNLAKKYQIMHVPTLFLFKNGNLIKKVSGFMNENELIKFINQAV